MLEFDERRTVVSFREAVAELVPDLDRSSAVGKPFTGELLTSSDRKSPRERRPERPEYSLVDALLIAVRSEDDSIMP